MTGDAEGISLLSMYGDDEEDEEAFAALSEGGGAGEEGNGISNDDSIRSESLPLQVRDDNCQIRTCSPIRLNGGTNSKTLRSLLPQPIHGLQQRASGPHLCSSVSLASTLPPSVSAPPGSAKEPSVGERGSRRALMIVDYAHDEAAMSPETEEGEIEGDGYIVIGMELQGSHGHSEGITPITSVTRTPNNKYEYGCLLPSDVPELSKTKSSMAMNCTETKREVDITDLSKIKSSMAMNCTETEREVGEVEISTAILSDMQKDDPLQKFLPPAITMKCSGELQEKIKKFLAYKRSGKSFNADLRRKKAYRNPDFLQHAVGYQDIEQIGTCFGTEIFDPRGYDKSDFYDELEVDMRRELEWKAQERKRSQKIDFVSGGVQSEEAASALKMNNKIPAVMVSTVVCNKLQPVSITVDAARDSRLNKKSKWDKAECDVTF